MSGTIELTKEAGFALIRPRSFLGKRFQDYKLSVEGATFDPKRKLYYATLDKVPGILKRLRDAEFYVHVSRDLQEALSDMQARDWQDLQAAKERVAAFDCEMAKKIDAITGKPYGLYSYQRSGIPWLALRYGGILADEMGLGKTLQAIGAFEPSPRILVVCPKNAKGVWRREVARFRPNIRVTVIEGRGNFRWPEPGEMIVINYDILPEVHEPKCLKDRKSKDLVKGEHTFTCQKNKKAAVEGLDIVAQQPLVRQALLCEGCLTVGAKARECHGCLPVVKTCPQRLILVFDEAHRLKNPKAQRSIKGKALSRTVRAKEGRSWLITGTPIVNRPDELWTLCDIAMIAEEAFGGYKEFVKLFDGKPAEYGGWYWGDPDTAELAERLERVMLRRRKADVLDLPPKRFQIVPVDIDEEVLRSCESVMKAAGGIDKILTDLGKALNFKNMMGMRASLARAKIPAMLEMVEEYEEANEPLVVMSAHLDPIRALEGREGWAVITGESKEARDEVQDRFQRGELRGVGLTIRAGGEAITLTRASNIVQVDSEWSPSTNSQAHDRCYRIGTDKKKGLLIRLLVADHPLDERVAELLAQKQALIEQSVDAAAQAPEPEPDVDAVDEGANVEQEDISF